MDSYVLSFGQIDRTKLALAGGKGANLGELSRIAGIEVPEGFCVTAGAYKELIRNNEEFNLLLAQLSVLGAENRDGIGELSAKLRKVIEGLAVPKAIEEEIASHVVRLGEDNAYAVRSSATAEDLPTASFAGQQDTYLNIAGNEAILRHIRKCWASLFTDRAVTYRIRNGFAHNAVYLAVVIQRMVFSQAAGVMFTADPTTSNRKIVSVDASFGLGEALVSGLVNADTYQVREGRIVGKKISTKKVAIYASKTGGTQKRSVDAERQNMPAVTDAHILRLERAGRKIEAHFGSPQDIEWCLDDDTFYIVQSRPITTLFPIPDANDHDAHVYVSVGHQQMMTDPIRPLGLSLFQLTAARPMYNAGGRLFVDVAPDLASPARRVILVDVLGKSDPLIKGALTTVLERGDFIRLSPDENERPGSGGSRTSTPLVDFQAQIEYDPAIVPNLIESSQASIEELKHKIQSKSGSDLIDFILEDIPQLRKSLSDPRHMGVIMTAMNASSWINEKMNEWLGERNAADTLSQSVPNNITSEMGLGLMDVADAIRPYPEIVDYLQHVTDDRFLDELAGFQGGRETREAIYAYLDRYGMRCAGEIDITRTRWSERPRALIPIILSNIKQFEPGAGNRRFEQGRQRALNKEQELISRLTQLTDGERKAAETKRMIGLIRNFTGYREYPKYFMVSRYFVYRQALLREAEHLVQAKVIRAKEDIYYLTFEELREVIRIKELDYRIIGKRKDEYKEYEALTPPRVMTSDGEIITGEYKRENLPSDAIVGLPVSSGVIEGRARVILNMEDADLEDGDILVTSFTDPSWTPLFVLIKGLVTEVGGLMTHGAVIAREYGLPAVVGVENATRMIKDGQRIRVNGTAGYIEILE